MSNSDLFNFVDVSVNNITKTDYYIMEHDPSINIIDFPYNIWNLVVGDNEPWNTSLAKRFYHNITFGDAEFPPIAKKVVSGTTVNFQITGTSNQIHYWELSGNTQWVDVSLVNYNNQSKEYILR